MFTATVVPARNISTVTGAFPDKEVRAVTRTDCTGNQYSFFHSSSGASPAMSTIAPRCAMRNRKLRTQSQSAHHEQHESKVHDEHDVGKQGAHLRMRDDPSEQSSLLASARCDGS